MQYIGNKEDWYKSGIYKISNKVDSRIYIGSSNCLRRRYLYHRSHLKRNASTSHHLQRFCNKYSINMLIFTVLEIVPQELLIEKENQYIADLKPEFNLMQQAVYVKGGKRKPEEIVKISEGTKNAFDNGRVIWNKGITMTDEQKQCYKGCSKGIPRPPRGEPLCLYEQDGVTLIMCYNSATEACKDLNISMSNIYQNISGRSKTTKYGIWKRNIS